MLSFFFNDTATTEIYTLSLHDALSDLSSSTSARTSSTTTVTSALHRWPGPTPCRTSVGVPGFEPGAFRSQSGRATKDRKSTRLNSSHANISYAVFCLKKKNQLAVVFLH